MDELSRLVANAWSLVREGYYAVEGTGERSPSFLDVLGAASQPCDVIPEIKYASPTMSSGKTSETFDGLLDGIVRAKPLGLSVLAEPRVFGGHVDLVRKAASKGLPTLFKDIVVDRSQVAAADACGASAVLLIQSLHSRGLVDERPQRFIDAVHERGLDVVLEVHTLEEWDAAAATDADILGINNRDLATMHTDVGTTAAILSVRRKDRPVIGMSGAETRSDVDAMRRAGADAVLIGTSIMAHPNPARKLEELIRG